MNGSATQILAGNNTFTGGVTINSGVLQLGSTGALNAAVPNAVAFRANSSGLLQLDGNSVTVSSLSSRDPNNPGTAAVENGGTTLATLTVAGTSTFAGVLQDGTGDGALALYKTGPGTLVLSGSNSFSGAVTINAGNLQLGMPGP